jgi:hypothetical protein
MYADPPARSIVFKIVLRLGVRWLAAGQGSGRRVPKTVSRGRRKQSFADLDGQGKAAIELWLLGLSPVQYLDALYCADRMFTSSPSP